jgi:hypothetical protein
VQRNRRLHAREKSIVIRNIQAAIGRQLRAELEVTDPVSEHLAELLRQLAQPQDRPPRTRPSSRPKNIAQSMTASGPTLHTKRPGSFLARESMTDLLLRRANVSRKSGEWQHEDYDVFDGDRDIGRIYLVDGTAAGRTGSGV